jgi:hypothetical protein
MRRVAGALVPLLLAALVGGCTGVPSASAPETVEPLDTQPATNSQPVPPNLGGDPREIVTSFLTANASTTGNHNTAVAYLTRAARSHWSDDTATIIANDDTVSTPDPRTHTVTVVGRVLGTLNPDGTYTPNLQGLGGGGDKQPFVFEVAGAPGRYRISKLDAGLLLTDTQFRTTYQQHVLYFYDLAERTLIPDLRWSSLADRAQLAESLIGQLAAGPRPSLQKAVSLDTLPAQTDVRQITVTPANPNLIEIPGSSQLDATVRDRLAEQLAETLAEPLAGRDMAITDGGKPVIIPSVGGNIFAASDFTAIAGPQLPVSEVYYLNGGRIRDENGKLLAGPLNEGAPLNSFAISRASAAGPLLVAGVTGPPASAHLEVGTERSGLRPASVQGTLTRPAFVPGRAEVWIGDGPKVYRVSVTDAAPHVDAVPIASPTGGGQIVALRFSPEGSRVAIVVAGVGGSQQLYIGSIVRGAGPVRIDRVEQISPPGVVIRDVSWLDSARLFAVGYYASSQEGHTFETGVDGSEWTNVGLGNLPDPPDNVAAATGGNVWVSSGGFVWKQSGSNSWVSPGLTGDTPGSAPVYLE